MKLLITGGLGYIGSHTCVELLNGGHTLVVIDNLSNTSASVKGKIETITHRPLTFIRGDLLNARLLNKTFARHRFDAVIHFAGLKAVGESTQQPLRYYENNVTGTINLLNAMQKHNVNTIVFSSSATVYGLPKTLPITEDAPLSTTNPYGATKLMIESILTDLTHANPKFRAVILRYFNPIGAHESGLIGENPSGTPNNLAPYIARVARGTLPHLNIFGNDYNTPDGTGVRDYIHVVDLARGHVAALNYLAGPTPTSGEVHIFNLGRGCGVSVLELLHAFERAYNHPIPYKFAPRRPGDIDTSYASCARAHTLLHWSATHTLDDMCSSIYKYETTRKN